MTDSGVRITSALTIPDSELEFRTSRSSGPGGQHVNKTDSRVELLFDVLASPSLSESQKARIQKGLRNRIDSDGVLHIFVQEHRSQSRNRDEAVERFQELLANALKPRKKRRPTRPTKASKERRLQQKRQQSEKKKRRGKVEFMTIIYCFLGCEV